jgi:hypothetical protein
MHLAVQTCKELRMADPKVSLKMRSGATQQEGDFAPTAGGEVSIEFDPARVKVITDYSKENKLVLKVEGDARLKALGLASAKVTGALSFEKDEWKASTALEWEISSAVSAKIDYEYSKVGHAALATVTIRF